MKNTTHHWGGGAAFKSRNKMCCMGRGYPCCCSGDRAVAIASRGAQTFSDESAVTCPKCIAIMARRVNPGPIGRDMGIPDLPTNTFAGVLSALVPPNPTDQRAASAPLHHVVGCADIVGEKLI